MSRYPRGSTICPECGREAMNWPPSQPKFYKVCIHCGARSPRFCPHDGVKCDHDCEDWDCWRELEGA